jgi:hypothetical protein
MTILRMALSDMVFSSTETQKTSRDQSENIPHPHRAAGKRKGRQQGG